MPCSSPAPTGAPWKCSQSSAAGLGFPSSPAINALWKQCGVFADNAFMNPDKLRAWWAFQQGLDGSLQGQSAQDALSRAGWARSVGGASPYLALFARASLTRAAIDDSGPKATIHQLPAAPRSTHFLPAPEL